MVSSTSAFRNGVVAKDLAGLHLASLAARTAVRARCGRMMVSAERWETLVVAEDAPEELFDEFCPLPY